jgi:hypothetical protein
MPETLVPLNAQLLVQVGSNPAANTEWSFTVPTGKLWEPRACTVALVQGATQTPLPHLILDDGTNTIAEIMGSTAAQAVSTTCRYSWGVSQPYTAQIGATTNVHASAPLPAGVLLPAGGRVRSSTVGIGANSDYGVPVLYVVQYDAR